ncbi:MAG: hypothetical protein HY088_00255 [Ignavibacteriales bacterium]|nr:hypothetical protein [Ignavibacteriales bacterium]
MNIRHRISYLIAAIGILTLVVGCIHFIEMDYLTQAISRQVIPQGATLVIGSFAVNHIASGIFLVLLGTIVIYSSVWGLRLGKKWARSIILLFGFTLFILVVILWMSVPAMFLEAPAFRWALILLTLVALLTIVPMVVFRQHFSEI